MHMHVYQATSINNMGKYRLSLSLISSGIVLRESLAYKRSIEIPLNLNRIKGTLALFTHWTSETSTVFLSMLYKTIKSHPPMLHNMVQHTKHQYLLLVHGPLTDKIQRWIFLHHCFLSDLLGGLFAKLLSLPSVWQSVQVEPVYFASLLLLFQSISILHQFETFPEHAF